MKNLQDILLRVPIVRSIGNVQRLISSIVFDSRKAEKDCLFVAQKGTLNDGHTYISSVIEKGATTIVCEVLPKDLEADVTYILVENANIALGWLAASWYDHPSADLQLVAVTGTNGKTTNATLLFKLFRGLGYKVGLLSTVQNQIEDEIIASTHTTPDALQLQKLLALMRAKGCTHCFMEASSHAIHQDRIAGLQLTGAMFTNITHDHLDYHGTFDAYIKAKKKLFDDLPASAFALSNIDDKRGQVMLQNSLATRHYFGLKQPCEFKGRLIANSLQGLTMEIGNQQVWFRLIGEFNAYNLLGVYACAVLLGEPAERALTVLSAISGAKGRFETVISATGIIGIVDYAHTPDALENVLSTIDSLRTRNEKVITVVGCGGNRDAAKRPLMAEIACRKSDLVILTSDNPRNESPETILDQMEAGVPPLHFKKVKRISNRHEAIQQSVQIAEKGDIILVAGKGHENYQEIAGVKHHFDDIEELNQSYSLFQK